MCEQTPTVDQLREDLLRNYRLVDVAPVSDPRGREAVINHGSYGRILKVLVNGALCAAKEIHYNIVGGPDNIYVRQFIRECELMSQMRHPNVVQFLGVYQYSSNRYQMENSLPWLVMEYVPFELHSLLERPIELPMSVRVSILLDITRGLSYLHNNHSSLEIIHRDLSARNVLLTSSLIAKLADFGVSRQRDLGMTMTSNTGNVLYMPPENKAGSNTRYSTKMDIFSFGVIILFVIVKEFPQNVLSETYTDESGQIYARTEIARRQGYFDHVEGSPDPTVRTLVGMCRNCLEYEPQRRPTAEGLICQMSVLTQATELEKLQVMMRLHEPEATREDISNQYEEEEQETARQNMDDAEVITILEAQVIDLREQLEHCLQEVTVAQDEASQLRHWQEQHAATQSNFQELERQYRETSDRLRNLQEEMSKTLGELSQARGALTQSQEEVTQKNSDLEHKQWQLNNRQFALDRQSEIADHYKAMSDMEEPEVIQQLQMALQEVESINEDSQLHLFGEIREKETEVVQLRKIIQKTEEQNAATESNLQYLRQEFRDTTIRLQTLQEELSQTQRELARSQEEVVQQRRELKHMEWQLSDKQRALDEAREAVTDSYKTIVNMGESEERMLRQKLLHMQKAKDNLEDLSQNLSGQIRKKDAQVAQLKELVKRREDDYLLVKERALYFKEQFDKLTAERAACEENFPLLPPSGLKTTLTLSCFKQDPSPFGLHSAQCVRYQNKVLLGGAMQAAESSQKKVILSYDLDLGKWCCGSEHLSHPVRLMHFAITVVNGKLLIVGGYNEAVNKCSDQIFEYSENEGWKEFRRLPSTRARAAAFGYRNWLVVAGGCTDNAHPLDQVIALDCSTSSSSWKTLASLPERIQDFQSASYTSLHHSDPTKDTAVVYLTSRRQGLKQTQPTMGASIPDLIHRGARWMKIPDPPVRSPGVVTLRGHLLALGGQDSKRTTTLSNKVYMYHLGTREWLPVAEVNNPRAMCVCVGLSDTKFMVLGGKDKTTEYSPTVEVFNLPSSR